MGVASEEAVGGPAWQHMGEVPSNTETHGRSGPPPSKSLGGARLADSGTRGHAASNTEAAAAANYSIKGHAQLNPSSPKVVGHSLRIGALAWKVWMQKGTVQASARVRYRQAAGHQRRRSPASH